MRKCVFCKLRYQKGSKTSFHRFPVESTHRNIWLQNMKAVNWIPKERDFLCSKHFDSNCFIEHCNRTTLKVGSVPTIFQGLCEGEKFFNGVEIVDTSDNASEGKGIKVEERLELLSENITGNNRFYLDPEFNNGVKIDTSDNAFEEKEIKIEEGLELLSENITGENRFHLDPKLFNGVKITDTNYNTSEEKGIKVEEGLELLSENITGEKRFHLDECAKETSVTDLRHKASNDHTYVAPKTPKKSKIEYGIMHDHLYENTLNSSRISAQRAKTALKHAKSRIKALTQRVQRQSVKISNLKSVIVDLKKQNKLFKECRCYRQSV